MMDMGLRVRLGGHMHRAHAHLMRCFKVSADILKHRRLGGLKRISGKNRFKSRALGLWAKAGVLHAIDCIERIRKPASLQDAGGIFAATIGIDNAAPRQRPYQGSKIGGRSKPREINIMHIVQIWPRIDPVFCHQPGQCGAVGGPVFPAQPVGLFMGNVQLPHDPGCHADFDLRKQRRFWRVKRVVQIENPGAYMLKRELWHGAVIPAAACREKPEKALLETHADPGQADAAMEKRMQEKHLGPKDAYQMILDAIDRGDYKPGERLVESDLAQRLGVSRTPVREALQRLETQAILRRDGRSLIVASLDHNQLAELYVVRTELEGLAAALAAKHAAPEEIRVLRELVSDDAGRVDDPEALSRSNRRFHKQIHLASHNRYLIEQLALVHRTMALLATTSLSVEGRGVAAVEEHARIVEAIAAGDGVSAREALKAHISQAFETRLKIVAAADDDVT